MVCVLLDWRVVHPGLVPTAAIMYVGTAEYLTPLSSDYFVTWISRILFAILFDTLICLYLLSVYRVEGAPYYYQIMKVQLMPDSQTVEYTMVNANGQDGKP